MEETKRKMQEDKRRLQNKQQDKIKKERIEIEKRRQEHIKYYGQFNNTEGEIKKDDRGLMTRVQREESENEEEAVESSRLRNKKDTMEGFNSRDRSLFELIYDLIECMDNSYEFRKIMMSILEEFRNNKY